MYASASQVELTNSASETDKATFELRGGEQEKILMDKQNKVNVIIVQEVLIELTLEVEKK